VSGLSGSTLTCAVVAPQEEAYSETFIRDHIKRLPCRVIPVFGVHGGIEVSGRRICPKAVSFLSSRRVSQIPEVLVRWADRTIDARLAAVWKRCQVDVILAEYATTGVMVASSALAAGVPLVVHCHGFDVYHDQILEANRAAYQQLFRLAAGFVVVSEDMREQVARLGAPSSRIHYNPCGVDTSVFTAADPGANPPIAVSVGRFIEKKAPWATILAFAKVLRQIPDARLVMAGEGPLLNMCKQLTLAMGAEHAVSFVGRQSHEQIGQLMRTARVFVQHSVRALDGDSEGTPVAVLEASASGLPVVATAHAGIKDVVLDGETGLLVGELDVEAMADRLLRVLGQPSLAQKLGECGRTYIASNFSMEHSISRLHTILRNASTRS
jgi:colanic acid/amylovoran biosynthesis glycosyltransferase